MALNPNIPLAGSVPQVSLATALMQGISAGEAIRNAPILRELNAMKVPMAQQQMAQSAQNMAINQQNMEIAGAQESRAARTAELEARRNEAQFALPYLRFALNEPDLVKREQFLMSAQDAFEGMGITDFNPEDFMSTDALNGAVREAEAAVGMTVGQNTGLKPLGAPIRVKQPDGTVGFSQSFLNEASNQVEERFTPISGDIVSSQFGETGAEQSAREVGTYEARRGVEEETASGISAETGRGQGIASRESSDIARGLEMAQGIPNLKRAVALLDSVKTGGLARAKIAVSNAFGVTGADEGELSGNLGKAVLSQLRETFGAQFTQQEGERLESIEARFGVNPAVNRRLLANAIQTAEQAAERGMRAAGDAGDYRSASEIQELLQMTLDPDAVLGELAPEGSESQPQIKDWNDL